MKKISSLVVFLLMIGSVTAEGIYVRSHEDGGYSYAELPWSYADYVYTLTPVEISPYWYDIWASEDPTTWIEMPVNGEVSAYPLEGFLLAQKISTSFRQSKKMYKQTQSTGGGEII